MMATLKRSRSTEPDAQHSKKHPRLSKTQVLDEGHPTMVEIAPESIQSPRAVVTQREQILESALAALTKALQRRDEELDAKNLEIADLRRQLVNEKGDIVPGAEPQGQEQESQLQELMKQVAELSQKVNAISSSEGRQREDLSAASTQSSSTTSIGRGASSIENPSMAAMASTPPTPYPPKFGTTNSTSFPPPAASIPLPIPTSSSSSSDLLLEAQLRISTLEHENAVLTEKLTECNARLQAQRGLVKQPAGTRPPSTARKTGLFANPLTRIPRRPSPAGESNTDGEHSVFSAVSCPEPFSREPGTLTITKQMALWADLDNLDKEVLETIL
ncbi:hypothetical protein DFP72DRAFT_929508 [Ephemerocybe angulata]|uniref:Uncharacterized protein n=1 Tax=Ephemerocybe angulata TaxID=980116 RepID=A0A8H6LVP9_9AGAR|nr:hypothetical protein DFP72DRAFT_929508 [Tulosesus angulatus]